MKIKKLNSFCVINKANVTCDNSGISTNNHFVGADKMVKKEDYKLYHFPYVRGMIETTRNMKRDINERISKYGYNIF